MSTSEPEYQPPQTREELEAELGKLEAQLTDHYEKVVRRAQRSPIAFAEYVLRDEKTNEPIQLDQMHRLWMKFIWSCWKRGLIPFILAPFGSGKTALVAIALTLYLLGKDPQLRIKLISASDELAMERVKLIRSYIEDSPAYHQLFPDIQPDLEGGGWQAKRLFIKRDTSSKDPTIHAVGAVSSAIGSRADVLILDDVNDLRNTLMYPKLRKTVWRNYTSVFLSRLEANTGRAVIIATRWHVEDLFGMITRDPAMCQQYGFLIQAISDDFESLDCEIVLGSGGRSRNSKDPVAKLLDQYVDDWTQDQGLDVPTCRNEIPWVGDAALHQHRRIPLWPLRFSAESLQGRMIEMGAREFDRGYRQRAISDSELLWRDQHVQSALDRNHEMTTAVIPGDRWDVSPRYVGVDLAIGTDRVEAAYFVAFVMAVDAEGHRYALWMHRERGLSFGQQVALLKEINVRFRPQKICVETNGYQDAIRQHLGETTDLPIVGFRTGAIEKRDIEIGIPSLAVEWEHRRWHIPWKNSVSQRLFQPMVEEVSTYPNARWTDTVMAMLFARSCTLAPSTPSPRVFVVRF